MLLWKLSSAQRNLHRKHLEQKIVLSQKPLYFFGISVMFIFINSCAQVHHLDMEINICTLVALLSALQHCLWFSHTSEPCFESKLQSRRRKDLLGGSECPKTEKNSERKRNSSSDKRGCEILSFGQDLGPQNQWQNSCPSCSRSWISLLLYSWPEEKCCAGIK